MTSKDSRPAGKSWRGGAQGKTPATPTGRRAGWARQADRSYEQSAVRYRLKVAGWLLLFVALVAGFVVWLVWTPVRTPFLAAAVTNYGAPLPPNAWAREDYERFLTLDQAEIIKCTEISWESNDIAVRQLRQQLAAAAPGGPDKNLLIVYLSLHGAVNEAGEPCLLPAAASASDSSQWLRVSELLQEVFAKVQAEKGRAGVQVLLVLDTHRMDTNWSLGLLYNGFAERLPAVVEEANVPNLTVLTAAGYGQIGWAASELKGSVFGYFFWQGLNGAADTEKPGNSDRTVSLQELYAYLQAHVGQWVRENRADVQRPQLLPAGRDFPLVFARSRDTTKVPDADTADDARWNEVAALWQTHEQLHRQQRHLGNPLVWEAYQHKLLRLEQLLTAGKAYESEFSDARKEVEGLAKTLAQDSARPDLVTCSLPLTKQLSRWPTDEERRVLPAPWRQLAGKPPVNQPAAAAAEKVEAKPDAKPDGKPAAAAAQPATDAAAKPANEKAGEPAAAKPPAAKPGTDAAPAQPPAPSPAAAAQKFDYLTAASESWNWFAAQPSRDKLTDVLAFVDRGARKPKVEPAEIHFLRLLSAYLEPATWERGGNSLKRVLSVRTLAEQAAAPADERTVYWLAPLLEPTEQQRRLAEDELFVGTPAKLAAAEQIWNKLAGENNNGGAYRAAVEQAQLLADTLRLRDQAWAETPYLAEWLCARLRSGTLSESELRELITGTQQLGVELEEALETGRWSTQVTNTRQLVDSRLRALQQAFGKECSDLQTAGEDRQTLRAIGLTLASPLVTGTQRNELREKYLRIARQRIGPDSPAHAVGLTQETNDAAAESAAAAESNYLARLQVWTTHPAVWLLSRTKLDRREGAEPVAPGAATAAAAPAGETAELATLRQLKTLAAQGEEVRKSLQSLPAEAEKRLAETVKLLAAAGPDGESAVATRAGRSQADRLVRAAAPLLGREPWSDPDTDPVHLLRDLDRYYLLLWHSQRTLDDFYGPAPGQEQPYFLVAARELLRAARELCPQAARPALGKLDLTTLLADREKAAKNGLQPQPSDLSLIPDELLSKHQLSVKLAENLPLGEAAVYLQASSNRVLPLRFGTQPAATRLSVPVDEDAVVRLEYLVANNEQLADVKQMHTLAFYRGHLYRAPFAVERASSGISLVYTPPPYREPVVTAYGQVQQKTSIMFVLDCSGSMVELIKLDNVRKASRLKVARETLASILQRLAASDKPYEVGVMLYGRRVGWNPAAGKNDEIVIRDPNNPERFIPRPPAVNLHPSSDVEIILRVGPFTQVKRREVNRELDALLPMGETPLYLSIIRALESFPAEAAAGRRHVVVITDGFNEQSSGGPEGAMKFRKDVEDALGRASNQGVHLDIVGFNLTPRNDGEAKSLRDLQELTAATGGAFYSVQDPTELLKALEKSLGLLRYVVRAAATKQPLTPQPLELGVPCRIPQPAGRRQSYTVEVQDPDRPTDAVIVVEGGESLELYLVDPTRIGKRRLVHRRFDIDLRASRAAIADPNEPDRRCFVGGHLPEWQGSALRFRTSLQNDDADQLSPRPAEAWLEIKPVLPGQPPTALSYVFYDLDLEPDRPVPVLSCLAPNWPVEAKQAEIRLWSKLSKTKADLDVRVAELPKRDLRVEATPDVTLETEVKRGANPDDALQLNVLERHPMGGDLYSLKVELLPAPGRVTHRFNPDAGTVRHTFLLPAKDSGDSYRLCFTARKRLVDKAIALPEPLIVTVPRLTAP